MRPHDTLVIGINKKGKVEFLKSYDYSSNKEQAQSDLTYVQDNFDSWYISSCNEWKIVNREGQEFEINLP